MNFSTCLHGYVAGLAMLAFVGASAAAADDVQASNSALRKQVRNTWLAVYATFTPDQKAIVRDALKQRVARMETFRQKMLQRHGG